MEFRAASMDDLEEATELVDSAIHAMISQNILQWDEMYPTREDLLADIENNQLYVGLEEGRIAVIYALNQECDDEYTNGAWADPDGPFMVIHRLCVSPTFQNQGIAKRALIQIGEQLMAMGIHSIRLDAFSQNPYALRLYDKFGYTTVGYANLRKGKFHLMEKQLEQLEAAPNALRDGGNSAR